MSKNIAFLISGMAPGGADHYLLPWLEINQKALKSEEARLNYGCARRDSNPEPSDP